MRVCGAVSYTYPNLNPLTPVSNILGLDAASLAPLGSSSLSLHAQSLSAGGGLRSPNAVGDDAGGLNLRSGLTSHGSMVSMQGSEADGPGEEVPRSSSKIAAMIASVLASSGDKVGCSTRS